MTDHTPGPWRVETGTGPGGRLVADLVDGQGVLTPYRITHGGEAEGDTRADALLIAAAPALLEALEATRGNLVSLEAAHPGSPIYGPWLAVVEAALAQATGGGTL